MKKRTQFLAACLWMVLCVSNLLPQGQIYNGPEDPAGDISAIRAGYMNINRLLLYFENNTQIADYPTIGTSRWPNDYTGQRMIDVASVLVGSQVYVYHDSIPIDDFNDPRLNESDAIDTLYFVQSHSYSDANPDMNYDGTVEWGLYPVPGYCNEAQDYAAMSNKPNSWPPEGWPLTGFTKVWPDEWNGRYGRGITKAHLESYFVANDAQDMEYIIQRNDPEEKLITDGPRYLPRLGKVIGDFDPNVSIQKGLPWGGLGIRIEVRGYQWANKEAQDIVFWEYNISNISDYNLPISGFGYYVDNSIGGDASGENEVAFRDKVLDLSYVWEYQGQGEGGRMPGTMGYAYLESPGMAYDQIDNDDDGIIDEKRDNDAGQWVGPNMGLEGIPIDETKFRNFFNRDPRSHWEGDEDQDWQDGIDPDNDGRYADLDEEGNWILESGAFVGNDVGVDGVAPGDLNYYGPDPDGSECNHKPDFVATKGEPNFGPLDIGESDMVGLTSFLLFDWAQWQNIFRLTLNEDKNVWSVMNSDSLSDFLIAGSYGSMYMIFASSPFPFYKGRTERVSMAFMCAYENLAALNASNHRASNLFRVKEVAQTIYERDYQFAGPPLMPSLRAYPGDGKVILTWDNVADTKTREPLLQNINDFEGYKLYKSTDKFMSDPVIITNGKGDREFRAPEFQCDKIDSIMGYSTIGGEKDGHLVYLGDDTGIRHYFVDTDVQNGRTYYYALVAYDYGIKDMNIAPAENMVDIELDESENIVHTGQNIQIVTPRQRAAGYVPPEIEIDTGRSSERLTDGQVIPLIIDPDAVQGDHTYQLTFQSNPIAFYQRMESRRSLRDGQLVTSGIEVYDITQTAERVYIENAESGFTDYNLQYNTDKAAWEFPANRDITTDIFDGLKCLISIPSDTVKLDVENTGWIQGQAPINVELGPAALYFPYQYEIVFDPGKEYQAITNKGTGIDDVDGTRVVSDLRVLGMKYPFYVINKMITDSLGNYEKLDLVLYDTNENDSLDWNKDKFLVGYTTQEKTSFWWGGTIFAFDFKQTESNSNPTAIGDVYRISFHRPLSEDDSLTFTVLDDILLDKSRIKTMMDSIKVVPNPYISTNLMETAVANQYLNQRRQLLFTHIPANCTIRIFTPSGVLVDKIDVANEESSNGTVHWDLLSREGLEIAAGMYIFHVKSNETGDEKVGKFAVIK
ncbi:hypothetical protein JW835_05745 [bacterium]|nr:hypothetical protein [bacterium]